MTYTVIFLIAFSIIGFLIYMRLSKGQRGASPADMGAFEVLEIQISKTQEVSKEIQLPSLAAENMFASLHGLLRENPSMQEHISFELASSGSEGMRFYVVAPTHVAKFVESQIYAQYPGIQIKVVPDYSSRIRARQELFETVNLTLSKPFYYPIKSFRDMETDPISSVTSAISAVADYEELWFQILVRPIPDVWQQEGYNYVKTVREGTANKKDDGVFVSFLKTFFSEITSILVNVVTGFFKTPAPTDLRKIEPRVAPAPRLSASQELEMRAIENKLSKMGYEVNLRIVAGSKTKERIESHIRAVVASFSQYTGTSLNSFTSHFDVSARDSLDSYEARRFDDGNSTILNTEELATLYHLPTAALDTPNISWLYSKKSEPPVNLPISKCTFIGDTVYRSKKVRFGIADNDDRLRHMYMIGKSGTGKSTLFETMVSQDIANGAGVGVLDPHGETIDKILDRIPDHRMEDVIYIDPSDTERPIGLNLLELKDQSQKNLMASGLVAAIKAHFDYSWGPRLEYLLNYAILTLLEVPGTTMLGLTRLMEDKNYLNYILHFVQDPYVRKFWLKEFAEMKGNQKLVTEAIAPIQNKVNRFLASTTIRNILGQKNSTIDIWDAMNNGKIILMNLSKGKIGTDNANLLGALLVSRIQFFALQRARLTPEERRPFYLYVDEFQNFATGSFEEILSESRKYKLGLYLTHQYTAQLPEEMLKAVFGNVGTIVSFSLSAPDAAELEKEFAPYFTADDIIALERFQVYMKLMVNGMSSLPFSARILIPWEEGFMVPKTQNRQATLDLSRAKYGSDRLKVEEKINKWIEAPFDKGAAIAQEYKDNASQVSNSEGVSK